MDVRNIDDLAPFITKDGSEIRELLAHRNSCIRRQSLAEARIPEAPSQLAVAEKLSRGVCAGRLPSSAAAIPLARTSASTWA